MKFGAPIYFLLFFVWFPAILVYFTVARRRRERFAALFSAARRDEATNLSERALWLRRIFLVMALIFLNLAAVRPQMGEAEVNMSSEGIDVAVAFDVSLSMLAEDAEGARFEKGKRLLIDAISELGGDRIAVIPFSGSAFLQLPLTADYNTALAVAADLHPGMIEKQGTALDAAIDLSLETLKSGAENADKLLVVVSDGEDPTLDLEATRKKIADAKVNLAILPLGTAEGAPISLGDNYLKDEKGETVVSKLNQPFFDKCRESLGAIEIEKGETLSSFIKNFRNRTKLEEKRVQLYREQFALPLGLGILFFALFMVLPVGRKEENL